jgi:hypothetical protein
MTLLNGCYWCIAAANTRSKPRVTDWRNRNAGDPIQPASLH